MELFTVIFTSLFILPFTFPFIVLRLIIYCLSLYLKRKHSIELKVAKLGLLSFKTIVIKIPIKGVTSNNSSASVLSNEHDPNSQQFISISLDCLRLTSLYLDSSCTSILSLCATNVSFLCPNNKNGKQFEVKFGSLKLPINKIRSDLAHHKENFRLDLSYISVVDGNFSYAVKKLTVQKSLELQQDLEFSLSRVEFRDLSIPEASSNTGSSDPSEEMTQQRIFYIEFLQITYSQLQTKNINILMEGDCFLKWNLEFHLSVSELIGDLKSKLSNLRKQPTVVETSRSNKLPFCMKLELNGQLSIAATISETQTFCISFKSLELNANFPGPKSIRSKLISFHFDEHTILECSKTTISYLPSPGISCILDRKQNSCGIKLNDIANSLLCIDIESVTLLFPYGYNFANAFSEKLMGTIKWLIKYYKSPTKKKNTDEKPVDFDMSFKISNFLMEIEDDPFETKLRNNFMLLEDEYHEQLKRDQTLQDKINELKRTNLMLASSIVEELNRALAKKNSDIYIQRSKKLYSSDLKKVALFTIIIEDMDLKILADSSFHKHSDIRAIIMNLDPESPVGSDVEFSTIWCRIVSGNLKNAEVSLRDFPLPMLSMKDLTLKGQLVGTEQVALARAKRISDVYVGRNSQPFSVERSMTPMKMFHNIQMRCTTVNYTHGPCWDPILQQVSLEFDDIISASNDPSPSLPWWDKMRFIFHGQAKLNCNQFCVILHSSNDPYNQTEMVELSLSRAMFDMKTGKIKVKGDFDALLHTASKYDECRFIHIPNLDVNAILDWDCLGNPHDHYSVMPCAPDKVPDYSSHQSHDSYRSFRSQGLNLTLSFETQFTSPTSSMNSDNLPSMLFFGSTIRLLENQKFIFTAQSKLTRRGKLFNNTKPKKLSFSRIFKNVRFTVSLNRFQILYWSSVSKKHGIQIKGGQLTHSSEHNLKLVANLSDGLKHRLRGDWHTEYMNSSLSNVEVWLYNLSFEDLEEFNEFNVETNLKNRQYFISFSRISYNKESDEAKNDEPLDEYVMTRSECTESDIQSSKIDDHTPNNRVVVHNLKAAWTNENRVVVLGIYDAFVKNQQLRKNLSTEALKLIRIENQSNQSQNYAQSISNNSPPYRHQRNHSTTSIVLNNIINTASTVSKNRAVSMLQKLIADSENNPNVYTEESHSGVASETHLYGVEACQMDDIVHINCLIELVNSQVVLCGTETPGYVIVSAAHTEIRQGTHLPVWKNRTLLAKTTWTGSLRCMQYYATVDGNNQMTDNKPVFTNQSDIQWLNPDNIVDTTSIVQDFSNFAGSGHGVGGVVSPVVGRFESQDSEFDAGQVQLQRIISRCNCLFYYAIHTAGVPDQLQHLIPPLPDDEMFIEPWDKEVGVDSFTLTHQDLDISTNSQQYAMIMDIINNLLLFVEPHKKSVFEKLERMRFRFQLSADEDQRTPIFELQDQVRKYVAYLKCLERKRYLVYRASINDSIMTDSDHDYRLSLNTLSYEIDSVKEQLNSASEELAIMISCYKEIQLGAHKAQKQQAASQQGTGAFFANVIKRNEICFKSARWRVTDSDGQLGLADIVLSNFLYSKVVKSDDSVEHTIELGHLHVSNLIPNQAYKDVLHPTELQANIPLDRQRSLRVYCRELAPVAGIPVKEHLEVNVVPFTIQVTLQFFQKMVKFFFPERDTKDDKSKRGLDFSGEQSLTRFGSKRKSKDKNSNGDQMSLVASVAGSGSSGNSKGSNTMKNVEDTLSTISTATMNSVSSLNSNQRRGEEIEKMRERASKNHTFVYVKIPGIPIKVSYKGKKQKSVTDLKNMSLTLPTFEYHNSTWTWLDLLMAVKNDSKHTVIKQALKQKMKIRPSSIWSKSNSSDQPIAPAESKERNMTPVTDEDKVRLLLGQYAKKWRTNEPGLQVQWHTDSNSSNSSSKSLSNSYL